MAASLNLLVDEGKISWDDAVSSIVPEHKHADKPELFSNMTLRDICSHRTGLLSLDEITRGLDGRILLPKKYVIAVCNAMPIKHDLRANFLYNNGLFEPAGYIMVLLPHLLYAWQEWSSDWLDLETGRCRRSFSSLSRMTMMLKPEEPNDDAEDEADDEMDEAEEEPKTGSMNLRTKLKMKFLDRIQLYVLLNSWWSSCIHSQHTAMM
ncbi:hypothetical protein QQS21_010075 [Conoideocrella luteorostrata]|uniref:Beta-lactamase-related domain-containing protein n=1 Tax=Conoideocrella luteorostrata TaxID=1105319 RepID=A0AAJ0CFR2_9HYPO|nr:hypothetical protein QQS21_010075 [Conoideocrella luteorostrata]